jgi:predicted GNAT family acetyltransferase
MAPDDFDPHIIDDHQHGRFLFEQEGFTGELDYVESPGRMTIVHTEVPTQLGGRGVGGKLVKAAVAKAALEDRTVVPHCSYARKWLGNHPDEATSVQIDWTG